MRFPINHEPLKHNQHQRPPLTAAKLKPRSDDEGAIGTNSRVAALNPSESSLLPKISDLPSRHNSRHPE